MRVVLIILALLLILAHPLAFLAVTGGELTMCAGFAWLAWRTRRRHSCPCRRTT